MRLASVSVAGLTGRGGIAVSLASMITSRAATKRSSRESPPTRRQLRRPRQRPFGSTDGSRVPVPGGDADPPGRHALILTEAAYRRTTAAIAARTRVGNKPRPLRTYLLRGLLHCACGTRMRGEAHVQRGTERRYYRCPTLGCRARRCPADPVEHDVLASIAGWVLPATVIDAARAELRRLLETPEVAVAGRQRARLVTRLEQLKKQHAWGDLTDTEYLATRDATRADLAELPDGDRIRAFDAYRARVLALPDAIEAASLERREELSRIVVQRVVVRDRRLEVIEWTPAAKPFFERRWWYPQGDSNP